GKWETYKANGQYFDVTQEMIRLTSDIAAKSLFSSDISDIKDKVIDCINNLNFSISNMLKTPFARFFAWLPTKNNRLFEANQGEFNEIIYDIINNRRKTTATYHDLLQMLLEAKDEETGEGMNDLQLRDEVVTIFAAGSETSSNALAWAIYLLLHYPDKKEKLQAEIRQVVGKDIPQLAHLSALPYANQVIQETLRLYPPAWIVGRAAQKDDEVDGYQIRKGTQVVMPTWVVHRHPDLWENPNAFQPERFENEQAKARQKFAHFPFGGGPRFCIGNNFAMMEMVLALVMIVQRFDFKLLNEQEVLPEPMITLRPSKPIDIKIT
ncbi:MAG: cytochrome P450, partial [Runella slithyformis]